MCAKMFYTTKEHIPAFKIIWPGNQMEPIIEFKYKRSKTEKTEQMPVSSFILLLMQVLRENRNGFERDCF